MTNNLNQGLDSLKETLQSDQFKKILPYLLLGGGGAAAGAFMTGGRRKRKESRTGYLGRVLRNALMAGGLTAGAGALATYGAKKLNGATAENGKQFPGMDNPTDQALRSSLFSPVTALGAGTAGLLATHKLPGIGAATGSRDDMRKAIAIKLGLGDRKNPNVSALMGMDPKTLASRLRGVRAIDGVETETARRMAGLTLGKTLRPGSLTDMQLGSTLKNIISNPRNILGELGDMKDRVRFSEVGDTAAQIVRNPRGIGAELKNLSRMDGFKYRTNQLREFGSKLTRRGMSTLGQTTGRRAIRSGVGLTAAAIPALIGAFLTDEKPES